VALEREVSDGFERTKEMGFARSSCESARISASGVQPFKVGTDCTKPTLLGATIPE
jgi:hypothetical protein